MAALVAAVSGCASGQGEAFQPSMLPQDKGVIYIFRTSNARLRKKPVQIVVNQAPLADLYPGQYIEDVVAPGDYLVRVETNSSMVREVRVVAGQASYLQVTTAGASSDPRLETPEPDLARRLIAGTKRAQP
jgi:hypothetical protein